MKLSIENQLIIYENALEKAKLVNLENPFLQLMQQGTSQVVNEPMDLFYKGSKLLSQDIIHLKRLLINLQNEQFDFEIVLDKSLTSDEETLNFKYFIIGIMLGLFLSLGIISFKSILNNNL